MSEATRGDDRTCSTLIKKRMKPIIATECSLPWDVVRMVPYHDRADDFLGPFLVHNYDDETQPNSELFRIRFTCHGGRIKILVKSGQLPRTKDLLVEAHMLTTLRNLEDNDDSFNPLTWPLPLEYRSSFTIPATSVSSWKLFSVLQSQLRCLTLRLKVYAKEPYPADSLIDFLNSSRRSDSPFTDIRLQVDGQDFPAHKAVLSVNSCVFMAMFTSDFKEKTSDTVVIEGVSKKAFGRFLDYLYTDLDTGLEGCELELLDLSERYQVERLKKACEMYMWDLDGPSALRILMEAHKCPVVTAAMTNRLCQLVAASWRSLGDSDEWRALQAGNPVAAGFIQAFAAVATPPVTKHFNTRPPSEEASRKRPSSP
ncbi:speckle-type POZ protein-like B [Thrips palmi]|uniref:Speckle-type POZ protein-like B n=1 Tax=Thrips palmi TaxID=161013 RepID=A0A6P8ZMC7_THRPL|nr:speckle-type POZ protein-like B [Thrips palmi]XP_034240374.1 speckle-type POZ protein-like B [Thrips palmi]XP_034240375.1 speckle-type POZ protein-like B [Thrips palmi]